jgi:NAD(P)-dependent dehydrogenase (short-subunit alcohol dehydrogenase family)
MSANDSNSSDQSTPIVGDKLGGRVALVTGGTRGIGAAICRSLASQDASVAAGYSANREGAEQFLKGYERDFPGVGRGSIHQGNISNPDDCARVVQEVLDEHGRLDILVNNAGHHDGQDGHEDVSGKLGHSSCRESLGLVLHGAAGAEAYV